MREIKFRSPVEKYKRSPKGILTVLYSKMKERTKQKGLPEIDFTLKELHQRYLNDKHYLDLCEKWMESGFDKYFKPSIDRINPDGGYTKDNIQMVTWGENRRKGDKENAERITTAVVMYTMEGKKIKEFESIKDAVKETGISQGLITMCCQGKRNHTNGYRFKYRGDQFRKNKRFSEGTA